VGLVQDGTVIAERLFRGAGVVSVGRSERNDLILFARDAPNRRALFAGRRGGFELLFDESLEGRVSIAGETRDLDQLRERGSASRGIGGYSLELETGSRGRIVVGEFAVLFQVLEQPRSRPRPTLPAALRGGPWNSGDRRVLPFLLVALLFHGGVIAYWQTTDWPLRPLIDPMFLGDELVSVVPEPRWIEREEERVGRWFDEDEDEWEELKENRPRSVDRKRNRVDEARKQLAGKIAERRAALLTEILAEAERQAGVLGSNGATAEVFGSGPSGADLERLIGDLAYGPATGHRSVLSGPAGGKNSGEAARIDSLRLGGSDREVETGGPGSERLVGKMRTAPPRSKPSAGFLDDAEVKRVVGRAKGAIKGCYERALPRDPTLEGRLEVNFTVSGSGKVSSVRITGNELNDQVGRCVAAVFERLRFPQPKGGAASFSSPFFFTPAL
jgi:hypothetical protein